MRVYLAPLEGEYGWMDVLTVGFTLVHSAIVTEVHLSVAFMGSPLLRMVHSCRLDSRLAEVSCGVSAGVSVLFCYGLEGLRPCCDGAEGFCSDTLALL